jgi:hypothetical protein
MTCWMESWRIWGWNKSTHCRPRLLLAFFLAEVIAITARVTACGTKPPRPGSWPTVQNQPMRRFRAPAQTPITRPRPCRPADRAKRIDKRRMPRRKGLDAPQMLTKRIEVGGRSHHIRWPVFVEAPIDSVASLARSAKHFTFSHSCTDFLTRIDLQSTKVVYSSFPVLERR